MSKKQRLTVPGTAQIFEIPEELAGFKALYPEFSSSIPNAKAIKVSLQEGNKFFVAAEVSDEAPFGDQQTPTRAELTMLPRWARVAFAARCALRVRPLFKANWPEAPDEYRRAIDRATVAAAGAANSACAPIIDCSSDAEAANRAARAARAAHPISPTEANPIAAAHVANVAEAAARAALNGDVTCVAHAVENTVLAAPAEVEAATIDAVNRDYTILQNTARDGRWTDDTPVPQGFFGPLWPEGPPKKWPAIEPDFVEGLTDEPGGLSPPSLVIVWDPKLLTPDQYAGLVTALGNLARAEGAAGIVRIASHEFGVPARKGARL